MKPVSCLRCGDVQIGHAANVLDALEMLRRHYAKTHPKAAPPPTPQAMLRIASDFAGGAAMSYSAAVRAMVIVVLQINYHRFVHPAPEGRP